MFTLHPRLAADCFDLGPLDLCQLLLMNDDRYPWCILVPRLPDLRDLHDVPREVRITLFDEIERVSNALQKISNAQKMNVAALGNVVPQLHIHVIARHTADAAWPGPVWGVGETHPYPDHTPMVDALHDALQKAIAR
ncbi:MAG: HIT domain-containing protein [Gammaproteobacteria bacterium]|nr:HIT domain-containing protein [Gammaproteobacteria bacterium]